MRWIFLVLVQILAGFFNTEYIVVHFSKLFFSFNSAQWTILVPKVAINIIVKICDVFFIFLKFLLPIFNDFSEFCCIFGTLHFEKSSKIFLEKMKKNLPIRYPIIEMAAFETKNVHSALALRTEVHLFKFLILKAKQSSCVTHSSKHITSISNPPLFSPPNFKSLFTFYICNLLSETPVHRAIA